VEPPTENESQLRAARNQALFRQINERLVSVNEAFVALTGTFAIACECADRECIETIDIRPEEYVAVRTDPRHFAVLPGHVYLDVERVVRTTDTYAVVEKTGAAAAVVTALGQRHHE
jgi:hypothetical protein